MRSEALPVSSSALAVRDRWCRQHIPWFRDQFPRLRHARSGRTRRTAEIVSRANRRRRDGFADPDSIELRRSDNAFHGHDSRLRTQSTKRLAASFEEPARLALRFHVFEAGAGPPPPSSGAVGTVGPFAGRQLSSPGPYYQLYVVQMSPKKAAGSRNAGQIATRFSWPGGGELLQAERSC